MNIANSILKKYEKIYPYINRIRGTYRLRQLLRSKADLDREVLEFTILDTPIIAPSSSHGAFKYYFGARDTEEVNHLKYLIENIEENDIFADIGACYGLFSSVIAKQTDAEVHSYEPLSSNILFQNLNQEVYSYDFSINHAAVSDEKGTAQLNIGGDTGEVKESVEINDISSKRETENTESVKKVCLDNKFEELDYVKIDVEGAELKVLKGMAQLLEDSKPTIFLELHRSNKIDNFNSSKEEVKSFLQEKGYLLSTNSLDGNQNLIIEHKDVRSD